MSIGVKFRMAYGIQLYCPPAPGWPSGDDCRMKLPLTGIIPPMITPLLDPDTLDEPGLERLIEHLLCGGVTGLFILGSSGEAPHLSYKLRRELIVQTCRLVRQRVSVLVGITDTSISESIGLARIAAEQGADAVVAACPYYFPLTQLEVAAHFQRLVPRLPLPLLLYNIPMMTKVVIEPQTVGRLLSDDRIIGIKDSSGNQAYFNEVLAISRSRPDWCVLVGYEHLLAGSVMIGGHGGVNGGANVCPSLLVSIYQAAVKKDTTAVSDLQLRLERLGRLYHFSASAAAAIQGIKYALSLMGICGDCMASPFTALDEPTKRSIRGLLTEMNILNG
jgi:2-dehydro-3-deoxy-D-pentonate aldolase